MKTVLLTTLFILCAALPAFSQKKVDVIYLKNDSVLVGNIIYKSPGVSVTLKTLDEQYLYIQNTQIDLISKQKYTRSDGSFSPIATDSLDKRSRYWFWLQGGGRIGVNDTEFGGGQVDIINGLYKPYQMGLGLGIGARFIEDGLFLAPVYVYVQAPLSNRQVSPIAAIGFGVVTNPDFEWKTGSPFIRADIGIQCDVESNSFLTLTVGFEQMNYHAREGYHTKFNTVSFFTLNVGLML